MASPYEIPPEMRDFAERSVAQARKAFEGFMGAVQKASDTIDGATGSASISTVSTLLGGPLLALAHKIVASMGT